MSASPVVPKIRAITEDEFHDLAVACVTAQVVAQGRETVAKCMGITTRQLGNIMGGSTPAAFRLYNLKTLDPNALDPINRRFGQRSVPRDAVCSTDPVSSKFARLLSRTIDMERPESEGGEGVTLAELLRLSPDDVADLRTLAATASGWIERIDAYRAGEEPKLRAVG